MEWSKVTLNIIVEKISIKKNKSIWRKRLYISTWGESIGIWQHKLVSILIKYRRMSSNIIAAYRDTSWVEEIIKRKKGAKMGSRDNKDVERLISPSENGGSKPSSPTIPLTSSHHSGKEVFLFISHYSHTFTHTHVYMITYICLHVHVTLLCSCFAYW